MNSYQKVVLEARKKFLNLTLEQEKELLSIYEEAGKQVLKRLSKAKESSLNQRYLKEMNKSIKEYTHSLRQKLSNSIKSGIMASAGIAANAQAAYFDEMGLNEDLTSSFRKMFSQLPADVVKTLISGSYYADGKTLDQRIWELTSKNAKDIDRIIKVNVAHMRDVREFAKQLDAYVNPNSKTKAKTKIPGMNKNIAYQAQRLARTSMTGAFNESYIQGSKMNPFSKGVKWNLSSSHYERQVKRWGEDICDKYATENLYGLGSGVYPPDEAPLEHPNGLCYLTTVTTSIKNARGKLIAWFNGEHNPQLDKWLDDYGEEFGL